jgi:two-component system cell cycle sensor histidine kinase/response regulator CckA
VLILEDDPGSAFILKKILARGHYQIAGMARSSEEAIELARTTKPDLLLMDIQIPGRQDGVDTAEIILRELDVPLIYMTAYSDEATIERARRTAPFAYLLKPYREKEMLITIEMALYKARIDRLGKASEQRLAATLGALEDYVLTTDAAGRLTYLNPCAERVLGKSAHHCLGQPLSELLDLRERETHTRLPDIFERVMQANFRTNPAHPLVLMRENGDARLVQIQTNALTETDGLSMGRVVILRDVTQLDELEENIRRAQKLDAVGRLAGGISHDFNNLLAIINSFADLLLLKTQPGDPLEKYYRNIRAAGQRGTDLVARLMNFSRRAATPPKAVAPAEIVQEVEKMMRPLFRENIELIVEVPPGLPQLHTDPGQIEQILVNLCLNARDAIAEAGRITISLASRKYDAQTAAQHSLDGAGTYVQLKVSDTGCGIPTEICDRIFEPFFTTKEVGKGTGLGLAMVYHLVKQNGGRVEVHSVPGQGTDFIIFLPAAEVNPAAGVVNEDEPVEIPHGHERVLLVEDDPDFADCVKSLLEIHGYTTVAARSSEDALVQFTAHHGNFDLLVADVVLPKLSGRLLAEQLRVQKPKLRVLLMSGYENVGLFDNLGPGTDKLQKPFSLNTLMVHVRQLLDEPVLTGTAN